MGCAERRTCKVSDVAGVQVWLWAPVQRRRRGGSAGEPRAVFQILTVGPDRGVAAGNVRADGVHNVASSCLQRLAKNPERQRRGGDIA